MEKIIEVPIVNGVSEVITLPKLFAWQIQFRTDPDDGPDFRQLEVLFGDVDRSEHELRLIGTCNFAPRPGLCIQVGPMAYGGETGRFEIKMFDDGGPAMRIFDVRLWLSEKAISWPNGEISDIVVQDRALSKSEIVADALSHQTSSEPIIVWCGERSDPILRST